SSKTTSTIPLPLSPSTSSTSRQYHQHRTVGPPALSPSEGGEGEDEEHRAPRAPSFDGAVQMRPSRSALLVRARRQTKRLFSPHPALLALASFLMIQAASAADEAPEIRTPKPQATPRINGPSVFGVRPGSPVLYQIPATGERPMKFAVSGLPAGLNVNEQNGQIRGPLEKPGSHTLTVQAGHAKG